MSHHRQALFFLKEIHSLEIVASTGPWQAGTDGDSTLLCHWVATQNHQVEEDGLDIYYLYYNQ